MDKKDWEESAVKHPGALHRELGVPMGKDIPRNKLAEAARSKNPLERRRADLAEVFEKSK